MRFFFTFCTTTQMCELLVFFSGTGTSFYAWKRGGRKDLYQVTDDWYQSFIDLFSIKLRKLVNQHSIAVRRLLAEFEELVVDPSITDGVIKLAQLYIEKLQYMRDYYEWFDRLVETFEDYDISNLVPIKKPRKRATSSAETDWQDEVAFCIW